jgi:hypothetical protein
MKIIKESHADENPLDTHYHSLNCKMVPLPKTSPDYQANFGTHCALIFTAISHTHLDAGRLFEEHPCKYAHAV